MRNKYAYCIRIQGNLQTLIKHTLPHHQTPTGVFYIEGSKPSRALQKLLEKETRCGGREAGIATTTITSYLQDYGPSIFDLGTWDQQEETRKKGQTLPFDKRRTLTNTLIEKLGGTEEDYKKVIEGYFTKKE